MISYDPRDFGAVADGKSLDTAAFQAAIDSASADGGGTVTVSPGRYAIGSIFLKNGVTLHLQRGAVLLGSTRQADYKRPPEWAGYETRYPEQLAHALILGIGQHDIAITGEGTIDGRGRAVVEDVRKRFPPGETHPDHGGLYRPMLILFARCRDVRVCDVTLRDPAYWTQCYTECDNVHIHGITVRSHAWWNNDGLDIADSRRVRISDCDIDSADDGICLKSDKVPVEDVVISNCVIRSWANAFKCGTLSGGGFRNICVSNLAICGAGHSGIALESVDGGALDGVSIQNVTMHKVRHGLLIRLGGRLRSNAQRTTPGEIRRVKISNLVAEVFDGDPDAGEHLAAPKATYPHNSFPCIIAGLPGHPVCDVTLDNVHLTLPGGGDPGVACVELDEVPENARGYPEYNMFGELPASAFFIRHARDVRFRDVKVTLKRPDFRPPITVGDTEGIELLGSTSIGVDDANHSLRMVRGSVRQASAEKHAVTLREVPKTPATPV